MFSFGDYYLTARPHLYVTRYLGVSRKRLASSFLRLTPARNAQSCPMKEIVESQDRYHTQEDSHHIQRRHILEVPQRQREDRNLPLPVLEFSFEALPLDQRFQNRPSLYS